MFDKKKRTPEEETQEVTPEMILAKAIENITGRRFSTTLSDRPRRRPQYRPYRRSRRLADRPKTFGE